MITLEKMKQRKKRQGWKKHQPIKDSRDSNRANASGEIIWGKNEAKAKIKIKDDAGKASAGKTSK